MRGWEGEDGREHFQMGWDSSTKESICHMLGPEYTGEQWCKR